MKTLSKLLITTVSSAVMLSACGGDKTTAKAPEVVEDIVQISALETALAGRIRGEQGLRDSARHPKETLEFFGLDGGQNVIEIYPGGSGWYANILAPYIKANGGTYTAAGVNDSFRTTFTDAEKYGAINIVEFDADSGSLAPASADLVLSFRNVHNWVGRGFHEKAFADFYAALKPGGVLGIVEHRLPESAEQDLNTRGGYVQVSFVKALAEEAGFEFVAASEVNANPKDTADHPFGVWTLPPVSVKANRAGVAPEGFDPQKYIEIGESDRFTLKFRKPG